MTAKAAAPVGRREARRESGTLNEKGGAKSSADAQKVRDFAGKRQTRRRSSEPSENLPREAGILSEILRSPPNHSDDDVNQRVLPQDRRADLSRTHLGGGVCHVGHKQPTVLFSQGIIALTGGEEIRDLLN